MKLKQKTKKTVLYIYNSLKGDAFELTETQFCTFMEKMQISPQFMAKNKRIKLR